MEDIIKFEDDFSDQQLEQYLVGQIMDNTLNTGRDLGDKEKYAILLLGLNPIAINIVEKLPTTDYDFYLIGEREENSPEPERFDHSNVSQFCSIAQFSWDNNPPDLIVCTESKSKNIHRLYAEVYECEKLRNTPFIYKTRGSETYPLLNDFDQWKKLGTADTHVYISSQFDDGEFESIYRYSLTRVKQKCQVRDAYDLYQCLLNIKNIDGDIIEFGSYQGHSGLIFAEFIKREHLKKQLFLCDRFDHFPNEPLGIDKRWSDTHHVAFDGVEKLFADYSFVNLVKGDFVETLPGILEEKFCLAHIDCDSFRATEYVSRHIFPRMANGGIMVFEDYGHHELLGARKAIDDFIKQKRPNITNFFSFFSGLMVIIKK